MKKVILLFGFVVGTMTLSAQDTIIKRNGEDIKTVITEVTPTDVKYKEFGNPDGPLFTIRKSDIAVITYADGRNEVVNQSPYAPGQIPFPKYKVLKRQYNYKKYIPMVGDVYSPGWSGTASFFIPGLGQIICGETGRGFAFLGGQVLAGGVLCGMALRAWDVNFTYMMRNNGFPNFQDETWLIIAGIGAVAAVGLDIWSCIDAVRVAKVKNMYLQDARGQYAFDMKMFPSLNYVGGTYAPGLTLAVSF